MKYIGFILLAVLALILLLLLIAVIRTLLMPSKTSTYVAKESEEESLALARKLSKMVQYDTTSHANVAEVEKFLGFHKILEELFPLVHEKLEKTEIDGNLLFYWKGKSSQKPILLMSHQDVVPAEGEWVHEPFSGDIADGKVWGRGRLRSWHSSRPWKSCCRKVLYRLPMCIWHPPAQKSGAGTVRPRLLQSFKKEVLNYF